MSDQVMCNYWGAALAHFRVGRIWFPYSRCAGLMAHIRYRLIYFIAVSDGHGFRTVDPRACSTGQEFRMRSYADLRVKIP